MKHKRVEAPRIPTLKDVHPYTKWHLTLHVYHKFHIELIDFGRKRVNMVLLDKEGTKKAAAMYDDQVDRLDPILQEGKAYLVIRISVEEITHRQQQMFANNTYGCRFTSDTKVYMIPNMPERALPFFPAFIPCDQVWEFTLDNDVYLDIIGMVLHVSSVGFVDCIYNRRILVRKVVLMDGKFDIVTIVVKDRLVSGNLISWDRSVDERSIVVVSILRAKSIEHTLHTTVFSRVHFDPDIAVAREIRRRINNDLNG